MRQIDKRKLSRIETQALQLAEGANGFGVVHQIVSGETCGVGQAPLPQGDSDGRFLDVEKDRD